MDGLFSDFGFNEGTDQEIYEVNGVALPGEYLQFMHEHDGGEGDVGENSYMQLFRLGELQQINDEYQVREYMDDYYIWGTDLGGMLFGYSSRTGLYSAVDSCSLCEDDIMCESDSLYGFFVSYDRAMEV